MLSFHPEPAHPRHFPEPRELCRCHHEASTGETAGVVVEIYPDDTVERVERDLPLIPTGMLEHGGRDEALQPIDEKVPRTARGVEEADLVSTEALNREGERPVKDEGADEIGGLAEGEAVFHDGVEILVQVPHQLPLEVLFGEAPLGARVRITMAPEGDEVARQGIGRESHLGRLRAEELGEAAVRAREVAVDPPEERGLAQVRREALEQLLGLGVQEAAG
jgi:hypothetical protein